MRLPELSSTAMENREERERVLVEEPSFIVVENSLPSEEKTTSIRALLHEEVILKIASLQYSLEEEDVHIGLRLEKARELMRKLTPIDVELKKGTIKKLDDDLIAEKTTDGKIILYEVVP